MYYYICIFCLIIFEIKLINSENLEVENGDNIKSSLAFVFDTTGSMHDDLQQLRDGAEMILDTAIEEGNVIGNFVFVPFHDPVVGPPLVTTDKEVFKKALEGVSVYGGGDCPEKSLTGIQMALKVSAPKSYIYVLTDATSGDHGFVGQVLDAVQRKQSQVVFILTGLCNEDDYQRPSFQVYQQIAAASSGQIFNLNKTSVHEVLDFVKSSLKDRNVNLASSINPAGYNYTQEVPVDSTLGDVTVSVSGAKPQIKVVNPSGEQLTGPPKLVTTLDLSEIMIVKVLQPEPGNWTITVGSEDDYSVKVVGQSNLTFDYGFSVEKPTNMAETNYRPLKGAYNHMMISLSKKNVPVQIDFAEIVSLNGSSLFEVPVKKIEGGNYMTDAFIPPDEFFYVSIKGSDENYQELRRVSTTAVQSKTPDVPYLTAPEKILAHAHSRVVLKCKVESLVPVSGMWYKAAVLQTKVDSLQTTTVEFVIEDLNETNVGRYRCVGENDAGISEASTRVGIIVEPPQISIDTNLIESNNTLEVGDDVNITCTVYSEVRLKTLQLVANTSNNVHDIDIHPKPNPEGIYVINKLIKSANESDFGVYTCSARNRGGSSNESVHITVESKPFVQILGPHKIEVKQNTTVHLTCRSKNCDIVKWVSQNGNFVKETNLTINGSRVSGINDDVLEVNDTNDSVWKCIGLRRNVEVIDSVQIKVLIKPLVYIEGDKNITIFNENVHQIECEVMANPAPSIKWYKSSLEIIDHSVDQLKPNVYKSVLTLNGSATVEGMYSCLSSNSEGSANDSVKVNYRTPMKTVQGPNDATIKLYQEVQFTCVVDSYPPPNITWHQNNTLLETSTNIEITENNTTLRIKRVDFTDLGLYSCNATNGYESVVLNAALSVTGLEIPVIMKENPTQVVKNGESTVVSCRIIKSYPKPNISWLFQNVTSKHFTTLRNFGSDENSDLIIENVSLQDSGKYRCVAENVLGMDVYDVDLIVQHEPKIKEDIYNGTKGPIDVKVGSNVTFPCEADGIPKPIVIWTKDGLPLSFSSNVYINEHNELLINNVTVFDEGAYKCEAVNNLGSVDKNFTLQVYAPPKIKTETTDIPIEKLEGQLIELPCEAEGVPTPSLNWEHNGNPINDHVIVDGSGIRFIANLTHFGDYKCIASNKYGNASITHTVYIWVSPRIEPPLEEMVDVLIGGDVTMECDVIGFPIPIVQWKFKQQLLTENTTEISFNDVGSIYIRNASANSEGLYTCIAENIAGVAIKYIYLRVYEPPKIEEDGFSSPYLATNLDKNLRLSCSASGKPKPDVTWVLDDVYLDKDPRYKVEMDGTLIIKSPSEDMSGNYTCIAQNMFGSDNNTVPVEIYPVLSQTQSEETHSKVSLLEHTAANIECPIVASSADTVKWYKDAVLISTGNLHIANVTRDIQSTYACVVNNPVGSAYSSVNIDVEYPPTFLDKGKQSENKLNTGAEGLELLEDDGLELVDRVNDDEKLLEVVVGDDVYLDCRTDAKPVAKIKWFFNLKPLLFQDKPRLKLINVQQTASGIYKCIVNNKHGTVLKEFNLNVLVPPFISQFDALDVTLMEGVNATLECNAKGYPEPNVFWTFDNADWHTEDTTLVANISTTSEGIFRCDARNKAGTAYIVYNVKVVTPAKIDEIVVFKNGQGDVVDRTVEAEKSKHIRISCKASGKPTPNIQWLRNGEMVGSNYDGVSYADLNLDVQTASAGRYTCVASNEGGNSERRIKMEVLEPPKIFPSAFHKVEDNVINMEVMSGQAYYLHCHPYGTPIPEVYWFKDDLPLKLFDDTMISTDFGEIIEVPNARAEQSGNYTCVAKNKIGNSSLVYLLDVLEPPPKPKEAIKSVSIRAGRPLSLNCPVQGSPVPYVMWIKHPYTEINENTPRILLGDENVSLNIKTAQVSDSGNYSCIMTNKVGTTEFVFNVRIEKPPSITGNVGGDNIEEHLIALRRSVVLKCEVDGHPLPRISWLKDTQKLSESWSNVHLVLGNSLLAIWSVAARDAGQYICVAENDAGTAHRRYNLDVKVPGKWSPWEPWSLCNVTCGLGHQLRYRTCHYIDENDRIYDKTSKSDHIILDESECKGPTNERRKCHMPPCEVQNSVMWSVWSKWSPCSATCGVGTQARTRKCRTLHCTGDNVQIRKCPDLPDCSTMKRPSDNEIYDSDSKEHNLNSAEAVFETKPQIFDTNNAPDDVEEFYSPEGGDRFPVYFEVNVTYNIDGSAPGPCAVGFSYDHLSNSCQDVDECLVENNECHATQVCINIAGAYRCTCPPGFSSLAAGQRCMDINECVQNISGCEFACVNVAGGYVCACPADMRLHEDKHHCYTVSNVAEPHSFEDIDPEYISASIEHPAKYKHIR